MSQGAVEKTLGKLVTDDAFRNRFFTDPAVASIAAGLELSSGELEALSRLPKNAVVWFSRWLDDRLRRLPIEADQGSVPAGGFDAEASELPAASRTVIGAARHARTQGAG